MGRWRFLLVGGVVLPLGGLAALALAPLLESWLFAGDLRGWLEGRDGSGLGGWVLALFPLAAVVAMLFCGRVVNPWLRRESVGWSPRRAGIVSLATFLAGVAVALAMAAGGTEEGGGWRREGGGWRREEVAACLLPTCCLRAACRTLIRASGGARAPRGARLTGARACSTDE
jgi:MFS family permease